MLYKNDAKQTAVIKYAAGCERVCVSILPTLHNTRPYSPHSTTLVRTLHTPQHSSILPTLHNTRPYSPHSTTIVRTIHTPLHSYSLHSTTLVRTLHTPQHSYSLHTTTLVRTLHTYCHLFRIARDMSAWNLLESGEQRYIKAINNNDPSDLIVFAPF